ncbi:hypothetical protein NE237_016465 [Protea cynaroides]|uniref:Uncharacterized protein n=1 Tax=Protea cynaroides TaxID=273540 RepID=A0A9Q0HG31_9MAGN|nr:hypothetical protein NE237_016465 [Protea cynaroides]
MSETVPSRMGDCERSSSSDRVSVLALLHLTDHSVHRIIRSEFSVVFDWGTSRYKATLTDLVSRYPWCRLGVQLSRDSFPLLPRKLHWSLRFRHRDC